MADFILILIFILSLCIGFIPVYFCSKIMNNHNKVADNMAEKWYNKEKNKKKGCTENNDSE